MKKRLLVFLIITVGAVCALLFNTFYREAQKNAIKKLNYEQVIDAKLAALGIQDFFGTWTGILSSFAKIDEIINTDADGKRYINLLYETHKGQIRSITRMDEKGTIIYTVPFTGFIGTNISEQKHVKEILKTHKPVISDVFKAVQGFNAVVLHVPIFKGSVFKGTIAIIVDFESLAKRYLDVIKVGETGYAWVISRDGTQLYSPTPGFAGKSVFENYKDYPSVIAMVNDMLKGNEGVAEYTFNKIGGRTVGQIKKYAVYMPIQFGNTFWSIVVTSGEQDVLSGLVFFRNRLILIISIVLIFGIVFSILSAKAWFIVKEEEKRKLAENELRRSEENYRLLIESSPDCICNVSLDGKFLSMNAEGCRINELGNSEEVIGESCTAGIVENREEAEEAIKRAAKGETTALQYKSVNKNGKEIWWDAVVTPVIGIDGLINSILRVSRDITEHRKLEEQLRQAQKMEGIGHLAGGIAHDFNNILSALVGYGHLSLMKMAEDDPNRLNIEHMLEASDRAAHLIKDLLMFSRKQSTDRKPNDLNGIIKRLEKFLIRVIGEDISFNVRLFEEELMVLADSHQLEQVLMNLATNARDAMPKGGAFTITTEQVLLDREFTSTRGLGMPGRYALISISDTGQGMDNKTSQRIFEPFFTTKEVGKGTGLGLAVVYGIIKQHEGHINVYSEQGIGSTFRIYLPLTGSAEAEDKATIAEEQPGRGTETILMAEDDKSLRKLSCSVLKQFGYTVIEAVDGEDAVKKYQDSKDRVQLLLLDLVMPKMNGKEAYDKIRQINPDIKVIFVSGYAPDIVRQKMSPEKDFQLIVKPVSPFYLLNKVREALDEGRAKIP